MSGTVRGSLSKASVQGSAVTSVHHLSAGWALEAHLSSLPSLLASIFLRVWPPPRILHALSLCPRGAQSSPSGRTQRLRLSARPRQALAAGAARATVAGAGSASAICAVLSHAPQCRRFGPRQRQEPLVTGVPGAGACEGSAGGPEGRELMPEPEGLFWPPWPTSWCRGCSNCRRS